MRQGILAPRSLTTVRDCLNTLQAEVLYTEIMAAAHDMSDGLVVAPHLLPPPGLPCGLDLLVPSILARNQMRRHDGERLSRLSCTFNSQTMCTVFEVSENSAKKSRADPGATSELQTSVSWGSFSRRPYNKSHTSCFILFFRAPVCWKLPLPK